MINKLIFSLLDLILLIAVFVLLAFEPVWKHLIGGGTRLKIHTEWPDERAYEQEDERYPYKIFDRRSGNRPTNRIGLPFQAGAMQSPSGQFA